MREMEDDGGSGRIEEELEGMGGTRMLGPCILRHGSITSTCGVVCVLVCT
jgi:hypothetical protein